MLPIAQAYILRHSEHLAELLFSLRVMAIYKKVGIGRIKLFKERLRRAKLCTCSHVQEFPGQHKDSVQQR